MTTIAQATLPLGRMEYQQRRNRMAHQPRTVNVSNPAAFGSQWTGESGTTIQLVNPRGTMSLYLGMRREGSTEWFTNPVVNPERFMDRPPTTNADWARVVEKWFAAAEDQQ